MGLSARNTRVVAVAVVVVIGVAAAGFRVYQDRAADLVSPGAAGTNRFVASSQPETSYVVEGLDVCLDRPGDVTITDVSFVTNQGGARVTAWGVRPQLATRGADPSQPSTLGRRGGFERRDVTRTCGAPTDSSELALEVRKSAPGLGRGLDLRITYDTGLFTRELEVEMDVVLCGPETGSTSVSRACADIESAEAG
ncbi:hypothetical protein [Solicola sp. PLA-1-18]|uniref:hypothetical protein n=1 Tax=Solicola sp. PLA-1-18 TaxID=3380532 RepID=UPI003B7EC5AE